MIAQKDKPGVKRPRESRIHARLYLVLAAVTYALNLLDFAYTVFGLERLPGMQEGNPFFAMLLRAPWLAAAYKLLVIPAAFYIMYRFRSRPLARAGLWLCFTIFAVLGVKAAYMLITYRQYFFP